MQSSNGLSVSIASLRRRLFEARLKAISPADYERYSQLDEGQKDASVEASWDRVIPPVDPVMCKALSPIVAGLFAKVKDPAVLGHIQGQMLPQMQAKMHNTTEYYILMTKYGNDIDSRTPEEETRLMLHYYLMLVEGIYTTQLNMLTILLSKSGHRYEVSSCRPGTSEMDAIAEDSLANKLRFLQDNGLDLVSGACDRQLRNSIAHVEFVAFTDGSVAYSVNKDRPRIISRKELESRVLELRKLSDALGDLLTKALASPIPAKISEPKEEKAKPQKRPSKITAPKKKPLRKKAG
ncbi:MAG TPA: hypothetical protein VGK23_05480 [Methanomassiliicoccales archaeon]|jgi:hypothetical protein